MINRKNNDIKAYYVKGCKINAKTIFSGYVLNINDEDILESIKRKVGYDGTLLCEITNEGFDYDLVSIYSIPVSNLTLGDFMLVFDKY